MISMKSLKIFLSILMLQVGVQAHANDDLLADIVKGVLGAKLLEGIYQEFSNTENVDQQSYSSDNRVNTGFGNKGSLGYQYYVLGQKSCKSGDHQKALKWFRESKQQGYKWADRAIDNVYSKCRESTAQALSRDKVCSNGVFAESYVDNECPSITNRWSNNNAKVNSNSKAIINKPKVDYINQIASRVKNQWRYQGAKDHWSCDVHILQDVDGNVQSVNLQSCNIDNNAKVKSFKNSIERAVYKASPLPRAPDQSVFDREILFHFVINSSNSPARIVQKNKSSFSDLWGQYGGSILDSNTDSSSNKGNSYSVSDADTQPPVIRFNHSDSMLVNDKKVTISGVIKDSSKITELLIKGKEVAIDENGNFSISRYVRLGRNTFDIVALDAFGNKATKVVTITRKKDIAKNLDKPLDLPLFKGRKDKNAVALIIGLDQYENIARAPWAESDATVFFDYAQQSLGIPADRIALITGDKSDRSGIYDSLDMWLPTMVEEGDSNVYVYFAGHGLATADGEQAYLIPYDGNLENLRRTAIPRKEVIDVLKDLKAKSVTLFMDTCYSGTPKGGNGTLVADSRGLRIVKKDNFSSLPKNFTIFSAASNQQTASSHSSLENGLFSYWMMRGLGGEADINNDRKITNGELHAFIDKNVQKSAVSMGRKQHPQLIGNKDKVIASW